MAQRKISVELEADASKVTSELQDLRNEIDKLNKEIASGNKETKDGLKDVEKASKATARGVGRIGDALKAAGIGLAIAAFAKLTEVFNENQKVTNFFNTAFEALSLAFNDFFNFLSNNIGTVVGYFKSIFSDPKQAIIDFGTSIYNNITERFNSLLDTLGFLATAVKKVFEGDFAGALESVKSAGKEAVDVITGVPDSFDKIVEAAPSVIKGITDYTKSTIQAAKETVELNRAAEIGIAQNRIILEQKDREAEKLRQIRDDETKTIAERIEANNKLAEVLNEQERLMLANADAVIAAAQAQFDKNANDENQIALLDARAEKEGILAQIEGFRSEQLINLNSLEKERIENQKTISELLEDEPTPMEELEKEKEAALAELELLHATEEEKQQLREKYAKLENELTKQTQIENAQIVTQALGQIASLIGEQTAFGKAVAVAQATIDTYVGANKALAQGGLFGAVAAAGVIASGIANVRTILATETPSAPSGGGSAPSTPSAPSFNVVGAAPENQLAETIEQQEQKPVKAFVVSQEVSSQQALDRNIESSAAIG